MDQDVNLILGMKKAQKSAVYIPIIDARSSRYETNLSTMINSGGRKGYPIWFASANFPEIILRGFHGWYAFTLF